MDVTFVTDRGIEVPAVTTDQMREVDRIAVEETGPNLFQMMENAGRNLAAVVIDRLGADWRERDIVVLAGTGGNGGGGIAAGRHLANRGGRVQAVVTDESRLTPVPAVQLDVFRHAGGTVVADPVRGDLVIDALIGYSLRSAPRGRAADLIEWANETDAPVVALDVPSGIDATSGDSPCVSIRPDATVTLALPKTGLAGDGVGDLLLADIGIPADVYRRLGMELDEPIFDERWVVPITSS